MTIRSDIVYVARWWASPGEYKPWPEELVFFFEEAGTEIVPTLAEAKKTLATLGSGAFVGGGIRHWCGIFACHVLHYAGVDVSWTPHGGRMKGKSGYQIQYVPGDRNIRPGDVAVVSDALVSTGVRDDIETMIEDAVARADSCLAHGQLTEAGIEGLRSAARAIAWRDA